MMMWVLFLSIFEAHLFLKKEPKPPGALKLQISQRGLVYAKTVGMELLLIQIKQLQVNNSGASFAKGQGVRLAIRDAQIVFTSNWTGEFFSMEGHQRSPLLPTPVVLPKQSNSMVVIESDVLVNSAAFVYFSGNMLRVKYTDKMLKKQFPGMPMELHLAAQKEPKLHFHPGGLDAIVLGRAEAFVVLPNNSLVPVFTLNVVSIGAGKGVWLHRGRRGEERKGKGREGKGKERKGRERKGKERKGNSALGEQPVRLEERQ
ncbi:hypothetical protein E2320_009445 [Naja naja]|nr:hypothetical protein E2320_009445 [Naja naja]